MLVNHALLFFIFVNYRIYTDRYQFCAITAVRAIKTSRSYRNPSVELVGVVLKMQANTECGNKGLAPILPKKSDGNQQDMSEPGYTKIGVGLRSTDHYYVSKI